MGAVSTSKYHYHNKAGQPPHPYKLSKDSTASLVVLEREKFLALARDQTLTRLACSLVTVPTLLSWLLIDTGRRRNRASIFFLSPTLKHDCLTRWAQCQLVNITIIRKQDIELSTVSAIFQLQLALIFI